MRLSSIEKSDPHLCACVPEIENLNKNGDLQACIALVGGYLSLANLSQIAEQWLWHVLGDLHYITDDMERAETFALRSLSLNESLNHPLGIARNEYLLGCIWDVFFGDLVAAQGHYNRALKIFADEEYHVGYQKTLARTLRIGKLLNPESS